MITGRRLSGVLSASEFERTFLMERARADRHERPFSMIVFVPTRDDVGGNGTREKAQQEIRLVHTLRNRLRVYDTIGRLDARRIGSLLPETSPEGAWTLADSVLERLAQLHIDYDCEVLSYPLDWPHEATPPSDGERPNVGEGGESRLAAGAEGAAKKAGDSGFHLVAKNDLEGLARARGRRAHRPVEDMRRMLSLPLPWWKRGMDIAVSATLLVLLSPLFLAIAVAIKLGSPGPVIFRQKRAGVAGKPFTFLKFRSMYRDAEQRQAELCSANEAPGPVFKMKNDPRITPLGRLLRRTSLDELPQLLNVLRGDMTLVGPRPPILSEVAQYETWQRRRLDTIGGLTCIWQVSGRSDINFQEWVRMDLRYIARRSFLFDLRLLARTASAVLSRKGAY